MTEVSVLIPTYNRVKLLRDTLDSIINQTLKNFEIIIYDDGSTDNTEEMINSLKDPRIRYIKSAQNRGVQHARNCLLEACKTPYAAWNGSDDLSNIHRLEIQLDYIKTTKRVIVGTNYIGFQDQPVKGTPAFKVVQTPEAYRLYK
jgi:glycosyltransferase involved in cell wall biosynthesis